MTICKSPKIMQKPKRIWCKTLHFPGNRFLIISVRLFPNRMKTAAEKLNSLQLSFCRKRKVRVTYEVRPNKRELCNEHGLKIKLIFLAQGSYIFHSIMGTEILSLFLFPPLFPPFSFPFSFPTKDLFLSGITSPFSCTVSWTFILTINLI